jgi:hypothetical protein
VEIMHRNLCTRCRDVEIVAGIKAALGHPLDQLVEIPEPRRDLFPQLPRLLDREL